MHYDIIVLSHLRWHSVFQRPQHIMTRLSESQTILFVEEPMDPIKDAGLTAKFEKINDNLHVLTPYLNWDGWRIMCDQYVPILKQHTADIEDSKFWFYSPFYIHLLSYFNPREIVYDCMDELSAFKNASPNLPGYERDLLSKAFAVFTGGKSLYESKKELHSNVYCFPSSVDRDHFVKATIDDTSVPEDLLHIKGPRVGYYGVIDERIDMNLIQMVAEKLPEVSFVMIGPFAKIDEHSAAKHPNIYYLGKRSYDLLPNYLKGFDVTIMPFALNEATKYISPTKTLEYIAAGKPVVSTPIYDVVRDYSNVVKIADNADSFTDSITQYLNESEEEKKRRLELQNAIIDKTSWANTVHQMKEVVGLNENAVL